jgi:hypothetical protein
MGAPVNAVDDGIGRLAKLIIETARNKTPDDRPGRVSLFKDIVADAAFDPLLGETLVDALDDVVTLTKRPQDRLGALGQVPTGRPQLLGETKPFL